MRQIEAGLLETLKKLWNNIYSHLSRLVTTVNAQASEMEQLADEADVDQDLEEVF